MTPKPNNKSEASRPDNPGPQYYRIHAADEGDEIVISGMSGRFPQSDNVAEYGNNLYNKVDMITGIEGRWNNAHPDVPKRCGRINGIDKFDATFFGVHHKQAKNLDPQCRMILEEAYMAVMDAGVNPASIRGSRTGVYVGSCFSEFEANVTSEAASNEDFIMSGCSRAMYANRVSYSLGLNGPSMFLDSACSTSLYGMDCAYAALRSGEIDAAIVGASNIIVHSNSSLHFAHLGVLSKNAVSAPLDHRANGYVRSEGVAIVYLQRRRDARRIYATLVHSKINCDGYKTEGITYPSGLLQEKLLRGFYSELDICPNDIGYMEVHSTGTVVGDPEECRAIDSALCSQRSEPLLIGSVKSNIGHTEPASGICSVVKVIHSFQTGKIPPNINFSEPRKDVAALQEGRLKVITETTELKKPYVGINSFGFGGANAHILLKQYEKKKVPGGVPKGSLPTLCLWSGRTKEGVEKVFQKLESKPLDPEYTALLQQVQAGSIPGMVFRGYSVLEGTGAEMPSCFVKDVQHHTGKKRPIVWVYSGMGSQWVGMGLALMVIPTFRHSIQRCCNALKPVGVDLMKVLTSNDPKMFDNIMHSFIGIAAIQIGLTDVLKSLGMEPDYIIGHSTGELGCGYADDCLTAEQMILSAYCRGKVSLDTEKIKGSMAAVGLSYQNIRDMLPDSIEVGCHNGPESCTISGPADDVAKFVAQLKAQNIFAREVPCSNIAYHTRYISQFGEGFLKALKQIIPNPKKRSSKWLSTSVPQKHWSRPEAHFSSAEYHTNNLLGNVLFEETSALLPKNALTIEMAPHCLLQSILKSCIPDGVHVGLTQRNNKDNHMFFLAALGKLYLNGLNVSVEALYPEVKWPVSCGTDTISDLIEWDHRDEWKVLGSQDDAGRKSAEKVFQINMKTDEFKYLEGHNIDGKILLPATFYLECVWKTFAGINNEQDITARPIEMENVRFMRATTLTAESKVQLVVMIHYATGNFEVIEGGSLVVSGIIRDVKDAVKPTNITPKPFDTKYGEEFNMSAKDFYKELKLRGYYYNGAFKAVESIRGDGQIARLKWKSNWVSFMDCVLQMLIVRKDSRDLCLPTKINRIRIFGHYHMTTVANKNYVDIYSNDLQGRVVAGGVELIGMETSSVQRRKLPGLPVLERYQFVPHFPTPALQPEDIGRLFIQLVLENNPSSKLKLVEVIPKADQIPIIGHFLNAIEDLPLVTGEYTILSSNEYEDLPSGVTVENGDISECIHSSFVIDQTGGEVLEITNKLAESTYLVLVVSAGKSLTVPEEFSVLAISPWKGNSQRLMLLRKNEKVRVNRVAILKIASSDFEFQWLKQAQEILTTKDLILVTEKDKFSGVLGLTNCLRKEYVKTIVQCVLIDDPKAPAFDIEHPFYASQLALGMAVNIYRNGHWGTYRHLQLTVDYPVSPYTGHVYGNILHRGDMSSLKWLQGQKDANKSQIKIVYASLNFKDIMLATGRISGDIFGEGRLQQDCVLGMEYSGVDKKTGKHVMGIVEKAAVASHIDLSSELTMEVPKNWTLREAATVPVVYFTVYYSFFIRTDIRKGKSILIHAGTGGIGLAAIRTALAYGLEVFTTVSTAEKRNYLLKTFPQLKESHIGNSRDTSFEAMVRKETNNKGVDFVLNSLSEEKLIASVNCLGRGGVFLEIGKYDMANDNPLGMGPFLKELSFVAVLLDLVISCNDVALKKELCNLIAKDIANGIIQPIPSTVFPAKDMEQAFRFLASAKHIGKVLIQVHESGESKTSLPMQVLPQVYFSPELVYIVPGGLGGFGLELVDWMVLRGARNIILSSSRGITNGYQLYRIHTWKSYGCEVRISTANISTKSGCEALLRSSMTLGPIGGIFNLAVVLRDEIFENQSVESFKESFAPKALATIYLDELSRQLCPNLQQFVIFSSVSCGRGNVGQTNYGMANSIMERIIEDRVANGYPGKAIEWGAVGEVGLVANMAEDKVDMEIGGTLQQRISSCLRELDTLLSCSDPLVASMVVAEKRLGQAGTETLFETILNMMNIRDAKSVSYSATLSELGMDSLTGVDIKQTLERDFDIFLSPQDLRSLTVQKLYEYSEEREKQGNGSNTVKVATKTVGLQTNRIVHNLGDEINFERVVVPINQGKRAKFPVFFFPGIEGSSGQIWLDLGKHIEAPSHVIQLHKTATMVSLDEIAQFALKQIKAMLKPGENFRLVGFSFGSLLAIKITHLLEKLGHKGKILLIDGSPSLLQSMHQSWVDVVGKENIEAVVLSHIVKLILPDIPEEDSRNHFMNISSTEGRLNAFQQYVQRQKVFSSHYISSMGLACLHRCRLVIDMDHSSFERFDAPICLAKAATPYVPNMSQDYDLSLLSTNPLMIRTLDGDHFTILESPQLPKLINEFLVSDE